MMPVVARARRVQVVQRKQRERVLADRVCRCGCGVLVATLYLV